MTILIVDDSPIKVNKILSVIKEVRDNPIDKILTFDNNADTMQWLLTGNSIDLLILDLNLPIRKNSPVKKMAGLNLLNEINRRDGISKPESIIGLTSYEKIKNETKPFFDKEGWAIVKFNLKFTDWEETIKNKIIYLLNKQRLIINRKNIKQRILFITSSPQDQNSINVGIEQRKIDDILQSSSLRENFELILKPASRLETLTKELLKQSPSFLHFSGHGDIDGLVFEDDNGCSAPVNEIALGNIFSLFTGIKCVLLNACYSSDQACTISKNGIYVVGMSKSIEDDSAIEFSKGFYQSIGEGKDIFTSFKLGLIYVTSNNTSQKEVPQLWYNGNNITE